MDYMDNMDLTGDSQHGLTKGKWCLTNLVALHDRVTSRLDKGRVTDISYLDFCKALDTALKDSLVSKFKKHESAGWASWQIRSWLNRCTQKFLLIGKIAPSMLLHFLALFQVYLYCWYHLERYCEFNKTINCFQDICKKD